MKSAVPFIALLFVSLSTAPQVRAETGDVLPSLHPKIKAVTAEFDQIDGKRQRQLKKIALFVGSRIKTGQDPQLTFICTHNSRRSHMSQIWAQTAAAYYGVPGVKTFSGGTEATACNPRTVAALKRAGFDIKNTTPDRKNPVYEVRYGPGAEPVRAFSKKHSGGGNPTTDFVAVMTCSSADKTCPIVRGSLLRVAIPYVDPKVSDGSDAETATYDERCHQIAREMFYLMSQVKH